MKDYCDLLLQGHLLYWNMLGTLQGLENNRNTGLNWLSGNIFFNYYTDTGAIVKAGQIDNIVKRMKDGEIPKNLIFPVIGANDGDPRALFMETGMFKDGFTTTGMAHELADTPLSKPDKRLNIFPVHEITRLKAAGAILNTVFEYSLFSFEHFLDMMSTEGLFLFLAEYDGLPVGACMSQHGDEIVNISWVGTLPGYRKRGICGHLINAAEQKGIQCGKKFGVLHSFPDAVSAYVHLGYKEYCRYTQLVMKKTD